MSYGFKRTVISRRSSIAIKDLPSAPEMGTGGAQVHSGLQSFELPSLNDTHSTPSAQAEADRILDEARRTADEMLSQARSVRDAEIKAAHDAGYAAGLAQGHAAADVESAQLITTCEAIAANIVTERETLLAQSEGEIVRLAIAISERLTNAAIAFEPEMVIDVCRGAMRKAFQRETLVVLAHPDDLAMLREAGPQMASQLGGVKELEFVEERRLVRGTVVVRTPAGEIDGTFASKSETIERELLELAERRRAEAKSAGVASDG